MTRLFAISCNDPAHLREALAPARSALVADEAAHGYGVATYQNGEVLLQRQPKPTAPVDFFELLPVRGAEIVVGNLGAPGSAPAPENTPPFRYRSWVFGMSGKLTDAALVAEELAARAPDFLRRHQRGTSTAERVFSALLTYMDEAGVLDAAEPRLDGAVTAVRALIAGLEAGAAARGVPPWGGALVLTNGRFVVAARLTAPAAWWRLRTDRPPPKGRLESASELRHVVFVAEPRGPLPEGFEAIPARSVVTVSREFETAISEL